MRILQEHLPLHTLLERIKNVGYAFVPHAITKEARTALYQEALALPLEEGDHVNHPINKGITNEVRQFHERAYYRIDDERAPMGSVACHNLQQEIAPIVSEFPELSTWLLTEIGYQRYRNEQDWISPHRDRKSDQLLSVTFTLSGSAWIRIYKPLTNPPDYEKLELVDTFLSTPGTAFFLRAPGFGAHEQIIHEVMPPIIAPRIILNLRMRKTILPSPKETRYE